MIHGTMYGKPTAITAGAAVQRRPEYLTQTVKPVYLPQPAPIAAPEPEMMMPMEDPFFSDMDMDMMTVSTVPLEGKKDSNFARLMGVSLLVLGVALALRK
jgi:hypothetical protein